MKTTINIGTNRGNITNIEIDKPFEDISFMDVFEETIKHFGTGHKLQIFGWSLFEKLKTEIK